MAPKPKSRTGLIVGAVVVVILVAVAGLYVADPALFGKKASPTPAEAGGFAMGQVVHFNYTGQWECKPGLATVFPSAPTAAANFTQCGVSGTSLTSAEPTQLPEWVLVPAFAGLSIFGVTALGGTAAGFPQFQASAIATDCGAGGSPTGCGDHPKYLYSPLFAAVETYLNLTSGYGGLPLGVLPTPAHDHLVNTTTTWPNIPWGTIVVLVLDPNIWPDRASASCTATVTSNLTNPTANCLTSISALGQALTTSSSAVATAGLSSNNKIWKALGGPSVQVIVPGDLTISDINNLDSNLYIWFPVAPGPPPIGFPSLTATAGGSGYGGY
jgi:hypothetical protein